MNPAAHHEPPSAAVTAQALRAELKRLGLNRRRVTVKIDRRSGAANVVLIELPPELVDRASLIADVARRFERRSNDDDAFPVREVLVRVQIADQPQKDNER